MMKGMGNMGGMLKKVQKIQGDMAKLQEELLERTVEGSAGGGAVTVVMTGGHIVQSIKIDKDLVDPEDVEMLESTLTAGVNDAIKKVQEMTQSEMKKVTGGLPIPGMF